MELPKRLYRHPETDRLYRDLVRADVSATLDYPGDASLFLDGSGEFTAPPAAGLNAFVPDVPPTSPHADDDEFTASSLTGWTEVDHQALGAWSMDTTRKRVQVLVDETDDKISGQQVKDVPDTEYSLITKCGLLSMPEASRGHDAGIVVAEGTASTSNFLLLSTYQFRTAGGLITPWGVRALHFSDHETIVSDVDLAAHQDQRSYLRIAVDGDAISCYTSVDGQSWFLLYHTASLGWTPTKMGLGFYSAGSISGAPDARMHWDFFRVASGAGTSDPDGHIIGRYV